MIMMTTCRCRHYVSSLPHISLITIVIRVRILINFIILITTIITITITITISRLQVLLQLLV